MRQYFRASPDRLSRIITWLVSALFIGVAWVSSGIVAHFHSRSLPWLPVTVVALTWVVCYALRPEGYLVSAEHITVRRKIFRKTFLISELEGAEPLEKEAISWSLRTFGVGGLFGYYGSFWNRKLGAMTWYLSRRDRVVLLRFRNGTKVLLSPDDPHTFLQAIGF